MSTKNDEVVKTTTRDNEESGYLHEALHKLSNGRLAVTRETSKGSFVICNQEDSKNNLRPGQVLLECPSASIALDPPYRHTHCGFCARQLINTEATTTTASTTTFLPCPQCFVITTCRDCQEKGADRWHTSSGECRLLRCLVDSCCQVFYHGMMSVQDVAQRHIESIYIITIRLVHRRRHDNVVVKSSSSSSSSASSYPVPEIDWKLFDLLYSSPLPPEESLKAMAALLQKMNHTLAQERQQQQKQEQKRQSTTCTTKTAPAPPPPPLSSKPKTLSSSVEFVHAPLSSKECLDIFQKCKGCCHALTDLCRPLGSQNLGMALFIPHSFYNHGCSPNAFLSCCIPPPPPSTSHVISILPTSLNAAAGGGRGRGTTGDKEGGKNSRSAAAVMARVVVSCHAHILKKGDPILLSYIPLSGLCYRERQMRLKESYHFVCKCNICKDADIPNTQAYQLEQALGGTDFAAAAAASASPSSSSNDEVIQVLKPLRELQIECHQNLTNATAVITTASSKEGKEREEEDETATNIMEQCIAMLRMAQRGIQNNKIPKSHEVALECHRLLAVAYHLLNRLPQRQQDDESNDNGVNNADQELHHHQEFLRAATVIGPLIDPSALAIQHRLLAKCLQNKLDYGCNNRNVSSTNEEVDFKQQQEFHFEKAIEVATTAVGEDHPFVALLKMPLASNNGADTSKSTANKRRKVGQEDT